MERLCERPGCSEQASVAYGMRAPDLVFWLDALPADHPDDVGALCRRHADSMVVPRGWTLDDLRDPDLHLFRPPDRAPTSRLRPRSDASRRSAEGVEQLALTVHDVAATVERPAGIVAEAEPGEGSPWTPTFDEADDLDGLLSARSPLLSRAFRTAERPGA
jgi:hypothetical protein